MSKVRFDFICVQVCGQMCFYLARNSAYGHFVGMSCALCLQNAVLRNSHILPEFLYKPIYDPLHRAHAISADPSQADYFIQRGIREPLLCEACEQKFSRWELYAKENFFDEPQSHVQISRNLILVSGLDYKKFRPFELSLLWRMGVSRSPHFSNVELGPHAEILRAILVKEDTMAFDRYSCFRFIAKIGGKVYTDGLISPFKGRLNGISCYILYVCGIVHIFTVGNQAHIPPKEIMDHCLNTIGEMKIPILEARDLPFLSEVIQDFGMAIHERRNRGV